MKTWNRYCYAHQWWVCCTRNSSTSPPQLSWLSVTITIMYAVIFRLTRRIRTTVGLSCSISWSCNGGQQRLRITTVLWSRFELDWHNYAKTFQVLSLLPGSKFFWWNPDTFSGCILWLHKAVMACVIAEYDICTRYILGTSRAGMMRPGNL